MPDIESRDRRKCVRFPIRIPLMYKVDSSDFPAETHDLSAEGIGLETKQELAVDRPVDISFEMVDNAQKVFTKGKIIWSRKTDFNKYRVGINIQDKHFKPIPIVLRTLNQNLGFASY
jgi:hypothetical protein